MPAAMSSNASRPAFISNPKSEPLAGQLAVGKVIANRAESGGRFPGTYCGVLFQRGQFSFVHGHSLPSVSHSNRQWQTAVAIAKIVDQELKESAVGDALFFHARYVAPAWRVEAGCLDRQSRFLPLRFRSDDRSGRASARPLSFWARFVLLTVHGHAARVSLLHR